MLFVKAFLWICLVLLSFPVPTADDYAELLYALSSLRDIVVAVLKQQEEQARLTIGIHESVEVMLTKLCASEEFLKLSERERAALAAVPGFAARLQQQIAITSESLKRLSSILPPAPKPDGEDGPTS